MTDSITVTGNIATEPEHKRTAAGVAITTFRVASGQRRYDRAANAWVDSGTNYYTVSTYRRLAEHAFHSLRKGERVVLTGRLRLREWDTGAKRGVSIEIDADSIGHDLLFGTTRFEKDGSSALASAPAAPDADWPVASREEWTVPGDASALDPALVGSVTELAPLEFSSADGDTPF